VDFTERASAYNLANLELRHIHDEVGGKRWPEEAKTKGDDCGEEHVTLMTTKRDSQCFNEFQSAKKRF